MARSCVCAFLWLIYGFPSLRSTSRRCGLVWPARQTEIWQTESVCRPIIGRLIGSGCFTAHRAVVDRGGGLCQVCGRSRWCSLVASGMVAGSSTTYAVIPILIVVSIALLARGVLPYRYHYEDYDTMMGTCRENEVCNIVHHRHWMPSTVDKVCRCPLNTPSCPVVHTRHGNVMNVNSRTQMKFCAPLRELRPCRDGEIALRRKTLYQSYGVKNVSIVVDCLCDHRQSYWTFHNRSGEDFNDARHLFTVVQNYKCVAMKRCAPHEFCGYGRRDYGFIYHRCTCPVSHQCKFDLDEYDDEVSELFYQGPAYVARCVPIYDYDWW